MFNDRIRRPLLSPTNPSFQTTEQRGNRIFCIRKHVLSLPTLFQSNLLIQANTDFWWYAYGLIYCRLLETEMMRSVPVLSESTASFQRSSAYSGFGIWSIQTVLKVRRRPEGDDTPDLSVVLLLIFGSSNNIIPMVTVYGCRI